MFLNALRYLAKGFQMTKLCAFAPPAQGLLIFLGEDVLKRAAQADGPAEFGVAIAQRASLLALLWLRVHSLPRSAQSDPCRSAPARASSLRTLSTAWPAICMR